MENRNHCGALISRYRKCNRNICIIIEFVVYYYNIKYFALPTLNKRKLIFSLGILLLLGVGIFVSGKYTVWAIDDPTQNSNQNTNTEKSKLTDDEIIDLNRQIQERRQALEQLNDQNKAYQQALALKQQETLTLSNQVEVIDDQIAKTELEIQIAETEIDTLKLQIREVESKIADRENQINDQKTRLSELIRVLNKSKNVSPLVIFFKENTFSDFFSQMNYLEELEHKLKKSLDDVKKLKTELETVNTELNGKEDELQQTKDKLEAEQAEAESQRSYKTQLLDETRSSESQYQELLDAVKREQASVSYDITSIEDTIRKKLAGDDTLTDDTTTLSWPVSPLGGITATFHDPAYIFRRIFEHPAIDIRAKQGTPVKAAAAGYVARAKDAGLGYSYIMLIHGDGISTVYGHISSIKVQEESYVTRGQVIGLSGGMPGTSGAGRLTTGPHLHFEVRKDGIPVNPIDYLP